VCAPAEHPTPPRNVPLHVCENPPPPLYKRRPATAPLFTRLRVAYLPPDFAQSEEARPCCSAGSRRVGGAALRPSSPLPCVGSLELYVRAPWISLSVSLVLLVACACAVYIWRAIATSMRVRSPRSMTLGTLISSGRKERSPRSISLLTKSGGLVG
jgi:hypothetical protein